MSNLNKSIGNIDKLVGTRLRVYRIYLGLSQEELAAAMNISTTQIEKYENMDNAIPSSLLYLFSKVLNIPIRCFIDEQQETISPADLPEEIKQDKMIQDGSGQRELPVQSEEPSKPSNGEEHMLLKAFAGIGCSYARSEIVELIKSIANNLR